MASNSRSRNCPTPPSMPLLSLASYLICVQKMSPCSLVPRLLSDFISQPWRKIGRRPGIKTTSRTGNGGLGQYVTWTRFVLTESTISQHDVTQHNVTQHDVAICESFLRKILGVLSFGTAKVCNPRKSSLRQSYFSPICENFSLENFSLYGMLFLQSILLDITIYGNINSSFTWKCKYSCPVQLKGNMSYTCGDYVKYRKRMLFYKLYFHIWKYNCLFTRK